MPFHSVKAMNFKTMNVKTTGVKTTSIKTKYIRPQWSAPDHVRGFSTTRIGGYSLAEYAGFNLAEHVEDNPDNVKKNRNLLFSDLALKRSLFWLDQVHGTDVLDAELFYQNIQTFPFQADASYSCKPNQVCTIMTADCLPILFCNRRGSWVGAAHAGWRGLANGVIQNTIDCYSGDPTDLLAWLGPAICQKHFEVGDDVRQVFLKFNPNYSKAFVSSNAESDKFYCDLYMIARMILSEYNIETSGGDLCTFSESDRFYSYRRDGETGRMASLIWINR